MTPLTDRSLRLVVLLVLSSVFTIVALLSYRFVSADVDQIQINTEHIAEIKAQIVGHARLSEEQARQSNALERAARSQELLAGALQEFVDKVHGCEK